MGRRSNFIHLDGHGSQIQMKNRQKEVNTGVKNRDRLNEAILKEGIKWSEKRY
jgi:hypothetical protein